MNKNAVFAGLVYDENEQMVETTQIGGEAFYVIDDAGFRRHIEADRVDRPVLELFIEQMKQNKDLAVPQALRMLGKDDLFTKVAVDASLDAIDADQILAQGIPGDARDMLGMMGFRIIIDYQGNVVDMDQPNIPLDDPE